jgi:hypothetical protein
VGLLIGICDVRAECTLAAYVFSVLCVSQQSAAADQRSLHLYQPPLHHRGQHVCGCLQVRLIAGTKAWSCTIKLRAEWGEASKRKAGEELERQFGPVLTERYDVEMAVRRAQKAALNPSTSPDAFCNWTPPADPSLDVNEHCFTKTVVGGKRGRVHVVMALRLPVDSS